MIVLNKKRLLLIGSCVFLSLFVFLLTTNDESQNTYISTVSLPVSGKTVVVDAGHGVPDEGAESSSRNDGGRN